MIKVTVKTFILAPSAIPRPVDVYVITITTDESLWVEQLTDREDVRLFLKGVRAMAAAQGNYSIDIPTEFTDGTKI